MWPTSAARLAAPTQISAEQPERRRAPPRCSDIGFIVKHLPRAVDPETALHGKPCAPTQGGWPTRNPAIPRKPTMKPQRNRSMYEMFVKSRVGTDHPKVRFMLPFGALRSPGRCPTHRGRSRDHSPARLRAPTACAVGRPCRRSRLRRPLGLRSSPIESLFGGR